MYVVKLPVVGNVVELDKIHMYKPASPVDWLRYWSDILQS